MKRLMAFVLAAGLFFGSGGTAVSASGYGRDPRDGGITAQGEYLYGVDENNDVYRMNIVSGKKEVICKAEGKVPEWYNISISGNYLYYSSEYEPDFSLRYDAVYKVDIGSGKQTRIFDCADTRGEDSICGIITSGDRVYVQLDTFVHDEVPGEYTVDILNADGECLEAFTPCLDSGNSSTFTDAEGCDACAYVKERKFVDGEDGEDGWLEYTGAYNIVKIRPDLSDEKITIPAKVGKTLKEIVYCGEKFIYYIDDSGRLCRFNTETEKYKVLVDDGIARACYRNGAIYFFTDGGKLKKYKGSKTVLLAENVSGVYFFNDYILYYTGKALDEGKPSVISFK